MLAVIFVFAAFFARQMHLSRGLPHAEFADKKLRLLTYSGFVGPHGPGGEILARFKKDNHCDFEVVTVSDAGLLLERLKLTEGAVAFDVVLGLDQLLLADARARFQWRPLEINSENF